MDDRFGARDALVSALWVLAAIPWLLAWAALFGLLFSATSAVYLGGQSFVVPAWVGSLLAGLMATSVLWWAKRWPKLRWGMAVALICFTAMGVFAGTVDMLTSTSPWVYVDPPGEGARSLAEAIGVGIGLITWFAQQSAARRGASSQPPADRVAAL